MQNISKNTIVNSQTTGLEGAVIQGGIEAVALIILGKVMETREIRLGAHIEVIMGRGIKHGVELGTLDHADRARGEAAMCVGIIR